MLSLSCELYNVLLQQRIYAYRQGKNVNYNTQQNELPELNNMFPEFKKIHSLVLQDVVRRLDKAFDNFYRRVEEKNNGKNIKAGFPRFKSRDRYSSITYTQSGFRIMENGHIWLSKIGEIRMFKHRAFTGEIKTVTVKRDRVGDWFITLIVENDSDVYIIQNIASERAVGIDLGLKSIITTSDNTKVAPLKYRRSTEKKLKRAQKQLSRKKKGSKNREKARMKVAKLHRKIERQRDDFSHKLSRCKRQLNFPHFRQSKIPHIWQFKIPPLLTQIGGVEICYPRRIGL